MAKKSTPKPVQAVKGAPGKPTPLINVLNR